ncbi:hypothetical protein VP01_2217g2 [Puccinia sorghi]|uniref:Uncharacterized protein n=1 Tax=Puccinia sorghi TaxID=27349 RepID=A0A0L6V8P5_9BASI|nr:hypothetical protein VP01_2217g2 [Puccinia sorghi]
MLSFVYFGPPQLSVYIMSSAAATAETRSYCLAYKDSIPHSLTQSEGNVQWRSLKMMILLNSPLLFFYMRILYDSLHFTTFPSLCFHSITSSTSQPSTQLPHQSHPQIPSHCPESLQSLSLLVRSQPRNHFILVLSTNPLFPQSCFIHPPNPSMPVSFILSFLVILVFTVVPSVMFKRWQPMWVILTFCAICFQQSISGDKALILNIAIKSSFRVLSCGVGLEAPVGFWFSLPPLKQRDFEQKQVPNNIYWPSKQDFFWNTYFLASLIMVVQIINGLATCIRSNLFFLSLVEASDEVSSFLAVLFQHESFWKGRVHVDGYGLEKQ